MQLSTSKANRQKFNFKKIRLNFFYISIRFSLFSLHFTPTTLFFNDFGEKKKRVGNQGHCFTNQFQRKLNDQYFDLFNHILISTNIFFIHSLLVSTRSRLDIVKHININRKTMMAIWNMEILCLIKAIMQYAGQTYFKETIKPKWIKSTLSFPADNVMI